MNPCLLILFLIPMQIFPQALLYNNSIGLLGTGKLSSAFVDVPSCMENPACLGELQTSGIFIASERKYMVEGLQFSSLASAFPFHGKGVGIQMNYLGSANYHQWAAAINYGMKLSDRLMVGAELSMQRLAFLGYGGTGGVGIRAGLLYYISEKTKFSLDMANIAIPGIATKRSILIETGFGYQLSEKCMIGGEWTKRQDTRTRVSVIVQYAFIEDFFSRIAISLVPGNSFIGFGLNWNRLCIQLGGSYHQALDCLLCFPLDLWERKKPMTNEVSFALVFLRLSFPQRKWPG